MGLLDAVGGLAQGIVDAFLQTGSGMVIGFVEPMLEVAKVLMTANIDPFSLIDYWIVMVTVISAFYVIAFLLVGYKFLFGAYDAVQRAEAKEWAKNAVLIVITVNASLLLYSLMLNISSGIASFLWSADFESLFIVDSLSTLDFIWLNFFTIAVALAVITLVIRHIVIIFGVMIFPVALFMNFIGPLKPYGSALINLLGGAAFMNILDIIILIAIQLFWIQFNYLDIMNILAPTIGFLFVALANILLILFVIFKALIPASRVVLDILGVKSAFGALVG